MDCIAIITDGIFEQLKIPINQNKKTKNGSSTFNKSIAVARLQWYRRALLEFSRLRHAMDNSARNGSFAAVHQILNTSRKLSRHTMYSLCICLPCVKDTTLPSLGARRSSSCPRLRRQHQSIQHHQKELEAEVCFPTYKFSSTASVLVYRSKCPSHHLSTLSVNQQETK